ncbi:MAG: hypothetical protein LBC62_07415, partial [Treponema sp.]|nr:hypothetical protein [Treponema sp.]
MTETTITKTAETAGSNGLVYERKLPKAVLKTRLAVRAASLLDNEGDALFLGQSGEAFVLLDFGEELVVRLRIRGEAFQDGEIKFFYGESVEEAERQKDVGITWYHIPRDYFELKPGSFDLRSIGRR